MSTDTTGSDLLIRLNVMADKAIFVAPLRDLLLEAAAEIADLTERHAQIAEHFQIPGHSVAGPQIAAIAAAIRASGLRKGEIPQ